MFPRTLWRSTCSSSTCAFYNVWQIVKKKGKCLFFSSFWQTSFRRMLRISISVTQLSRELRLNLPLFRCLYTLLFFSFFFISFSFNVSASSLLCFVIYGKWHTFSSNDLQLLAAMRGYSLKKIPFFLNTFVLFQILNFTALWQFFFRWYS